jgi:hypothetical protein
MHLGKLVTACCLTVAALSAPATLSASAAPQFRLRDTAGGVHTYLGRIDNRVEDFGKQRYQATVADLRQALDAILAGEQPPHATTHSVGCATTRLPEGTR